MWRSRKVSARLGRVEKGKGFERDVLVKVKGPVDAGNLRVIAFAQQGEAGEVIGASLLSSLTAKQARGQTGLTQISRSQN